MTKAERDITLTRLEDLEQLEEKDSLLGTGFFGTVQKVRHKKTNELFALKVVPKSIIDKHNLMEQIRREIRILHEIDHNNIVKLYFHFEDQKNFYLGMECAPISIFTRLREKGSFSPQESSRILKDVFSALQYLHTRHKPIIHRDVKPENLLFDEKGNTKLCDFGWSNVVQQQKCDEFQTRNTFCGTIDYLAPEMLLGSGHTEMLDCWSCGVLLFEFLTGRPPFSSPRGDEIYRRILEAKITWPSTEEFDEDARDLINRLLQKSPKMRISATEALHHPFIRKFDSVPRLPCPSKSLTQDNFEKYQLQSEIQKLHGLLLKKTEELSECRGVLGKTQQTLTRIELRSEDLEAFLSEMQSRVNAKIATAIEAQNKKHETNLAAIANEVDEWRQFASQRYSLLESRLHHEIQNGEKFLELKVVTENEDRLISYPPNNETFKECFGSSTKSCCNQGSYNENSCGEIDAEQLGTLLAAFQKSCESLEDKVGKPLADAHKKLRNMEEEATKSFDKMEKQHYNEMRTFAEFLKMREVNLSNRLRQLANETHISSTHQSDKQLKTKPYRPFVSKALPITSHSSAKSTCSPETSPYVSTTIDEAFVLCNTLKSELKLVKQDREVLAGRLLVLEQNYQLAASLNN